jgi:uncharacterized protein
MDRDINALLASPCSGDVAKQLLDWATSLRGRILRGDMMVGILSRDEVNLAPSVLRRAADCGATRALIELAKWFADPPLGEPDFQSAEAALREALARDVPTALSVFVETRYFLRRNETSPEEQRETFNLLQAHVATHPDEARSVYLLGLLTCQGFGTAPSPATAFKLQERAADLGDADAMFELYAQLQTGLGVPKDERRAFQAVKRAAEAGQARALYNMGAFYASGVNVPKDLAKAAEWYKRASDAGNLRATTTLALMYAKGDGVPRNPDLAVQLFEEAEYLGYDTSALRELSGL